MQRSPGKLPFYEMKCSLLRRIQKKELSCQAGEVEKLEYSFDGNDIDGSLEINSLSFSVLAGHRGFTG